MLPAHNRMRRSEDFTSTRRLGVRAGGPYVVVHLRPVVASAGHDEGPVVGLTVSKAVGNAVVRNRVKRRLREIMRQRLSEGLAAEAVVLQASPAAASLSFLGLDREVRRQMDRALSGSRRPRRTP